LGTFGDMKKQLFLLLLISIQWKAVADAPSISSRHALVDIFCTTVVERNTNHDKSPLVKDIWSDLEQHFEKGKIFSSLLSGEALEAEFEKIKQTSVFKKCLDENKQDFEYGEFILSGKRVIKETLEAFQTSGSDTFSFVSFPLGDAVGLSNDLSLNLRDTQGNFQSGKPVEVILQRQKKYNALWHRFIADIKNKSKSLNF